MSQKIRTSINVIFMTEIQFSTTLIPIVWLAGKTIMVQLPTTRMKPGQKGIQHGIKWADNMDVTILHVHHFNMHCWNGTEDL